MPLDHVVSGPSGSQLEGSLVRADAGQVAVLQVRRRQKGFVPEGGNPPEGLRDDFSFPGARKQTGESSQTFTVRLLYFSKSHNITFSGGRPSRPK